MGIGKVTLGNFGANIFKTKTDSQNIQETTNISKASNPFGVSFKGNVIHADVFESTKIENNESIATKAANKGKLFVSALVGNILVDITTPNIELIRKSDSLDDYEDNLH